MVVLAPSLPSCIQSKHAPATADCSFRSDSHAKVLYYSLRCFMMDFWDHSQGECAASSDAALQKQLELSSAQVAGSLLHALNGCCIEPELCTNLQRMIQQSLAGQHRSMCACVCAFSSGALQEWFNNGAASSTSAAHDQQQ